jgi:hypothetical protein
MTDKVTTIARVHELISNILKGAQLGRRRISGGMLGKYFHGYWPNIAR